VKVALGKSNNQPEVMKVRAASSLEAKKCGAATALQHGHGSGAE